MEKLNFEQMECVKGGFSSLDWKCVGLYIAIITSAITVIIPSLLYDKAKEMGCYEAQY